MGYLRELPAIGRDIGSVLLLIGAATLVPIIVGCFYQEWYALPWMASLHGRDARAIFCRKIRNLQGPAFRTLQPPLSAGIRRVTHSKESNRSPQSPGLFLQVLLRGLHVL